MTNRNGAESEQGLYFRTPRHEIAYNLQRLTVGRDIVTVFHSEASKSHDPECTQPWCLDGDSVKVAIGPDAHAMPDVRRAVLGGQTDDPTRHNYWGPPEGVGGAGNPMTVKGPPGDDHFYTFYLGSGRFGSDVPTTHRIYLQVARTADFETYEVLAETSGGHEWLTEASEVNPVHLSDTAGEPLRSSNAMAATDVQGMIGSICCAGGLYHYFYTDYVPGTTSAGGQQTQLYHRTATDLSHDRAWSQAEPVFDVLLPITLARIVKDYGRDRWAILFNCRNPDTGHQDLALRFTDNLNVTGAGGLAHLSLYDHALGTNFSTAALALSAEPRNFSQHDFLTDIYGNLPGPEVDMTWTDFSQGQYGIYGSPVYWARVRARDIP